jgi:serine/threonine protein phosphatase 1
MLNGFMTIDLSLKRGSQFYFVSDVHGNYSMFMDALKLIGFRFPDVRGGDAIHDYIFFVGDMIDRGNESLEVVQFARHNPSAFAIRGNHEKMAFEGLTGSLSQYSSWLINGGEWAKDIDPFTVKDALRWANSLPELMEVNVGNGTIIGLSHSSVPSDLSWAELKSKVKMSSYLDRDENKKLFQQLLWDRNPVKNRLDYSIRGVDAVIHGHTVNDGKIVELGNRIHIDTGCGFIGDRYALTILEYTDGGEHLGLFESHRFERDPWSNKVDMV